MGDGCEAEVEVAQLQCCLQLHGRELSIAILVYGFKPLAVQTWCGWGSVCQPEEPAEGAQKVPSAGMQEGHCTAACTLTFLNWAGAGRCAAICSQLTDTGLSLLTPLGLLQTAQHYCPPRVIQGTCSTLWQTEEVNTPIRCCQALFNGRSAPVLQAQFSGGGGCDAGAFLKQQYDSFEFVNLSLARYRLPCNSCERGRHPDDKPQSLASFASTSATHLPWRYYVLGICVSVRLLSTQTLNFPACASLSSL